MSVQGSRRHERPLVDVRRLTHVYETPTEELVALRDFSFQLVEGERVAVVGPSGSGKTTLLNILAALQTPSPGAVSVNGRDLATLSEEEKDEYRRRQVGYAWQRAELSVWSQLTVGENMLLPMLGEVASEHQRREYAALVLETVGLSRWLNRLPVELGYSDRRRLALAVALANQPRLLLADEITAGLEEDAADKLLSNLNGLLGELGTSAIIVAHGRHLPRHVDRIVPLPYARAVAPPARAGQSRAAFRGRLLRNPPANGRDILSVESVSRQLSGPDGPVEVVRDVSFRVRQSEMVAIQGSSGAGKSVLLALCAGLDEPDQGNIAIEGQPLAGLEQRAREELLQRTLGWVMDARPPPHVTPTESVAIASRIAGYSPVEAGRLAEVALGATGLEEQAAIPTGQLSGGEQVRVGVARALARAPALIIADEPTAQLDILTSIDIVGLLREAADSGIAVLLATNSPVLAEVADRVLVMTEGTVRELRRQ